MDAWPSGYGFRHYAILDSTNEEARRLAAAGERGPLWITAREQSSGRGRRGRAWVSEPGNLFATLLTKAQPARSWELAFAAGLAAGDAVAHFAPLTPVALKWPNDVLLGGRKVSGLLLESFGDGLAIGVGINLFSAPSATDFPATSILATTGLAPDPKPALTILASAMAAWYEVWRERGFSPIREAWLARASGLGQRVRARLETSEVEGVFESLDEDGALLLRMPGGERRRIAAGDVFV